jgi:hypothetical protein
MRRATGGEPPLRGGIPHPHRHGPQSKHPWWVRTPATGPSLEEPASAAGAPASATAAPTGATAAPPEPSRKRKRGFSNLR